MKKVSQLLKDERHEKNLSLDDVAKNTKIRKEFLEYIEQGKFHNLPSESYALGFVKNYASFLGLSTTTIAPLFRREYKAEELSVVPEFRKTQHKFDRSIFLNTRFIFGSFIVFVISLYVFFQYSSLIFSPKLNIFSPSESQSIKGNVVEVSGETNQYNTVFVNGEEAYVDLQGKFKKQIYVFSGQQKISVAAKNRSGKETEKIINVKVE